MLEMDAAGSRAHALLKAAVVWDNHACLPLRADARFMPELERFRAAGVNVVSLNVGFAQVPWTEHLRVLSFMRQWIALRPERFCLVSTVEDVRRCKADGKLGVTFDIEGMGPVLDDISLVQTFYELGVRWMLIAYNRNNAAGGGCLDVDCGLSARGRAIIDEMERVGVVLCLSHAGARTVAEALEYARLPVIFSHSNPAGEFAHPRNVSDGLMRACAARGGVIGLSGFGPLLGGGRDLVDCLVKQLHYVIDLVGAAHVGLGLDYVFDRSELDEYVRVNPTLFPPAITEGGRVGMIGPESFGAILERLARDNGDRCDAAWYRVERRCWLHSASDITLIALAVDRGRVSPA